MSLLTRRNFVIGYAALTALPSIICGCSKVAYANVPTSKRLIVVFLRGGMDSLGVVVPYADSKYLSARKHLAIGEDPKKLIDLDGFYALHSNLKLFSQFYRNGELLIFHAVATPYRERSHFDAQDLLENGSYKPHASTSGWLNRTISVLAGSDRKTSLGLSIGPSTQMLLRGDAKVTTWAPSYLGEIDQDLLGRVDHLYSYDPLLHEALQVTRENISIADTKGKIVRGDRAFIPAMRSAAKFLAHENGPRLAVIDMNGWDTHANQGTDNKGRLPNLLNILSEGVSVYRQNTPQTVWKDTIIYIVTEFGRTVSPNGTGGTDHGTAGASFVIGGGIKGGRVVAEWPGLDSNKLYQGRDLRPTMDLRSVSKSILMHHYNITARDISRYILLGTEALPPIDLF